MELHASVFIARPVDVVFARWSEAERYPDWFGMCIERRKLTEGPMGVGSKYLAVDRLPPGRRVESTLEIVAFEPNQRMAATLSAPINVSWDARFEETDGGTRMTFETTAQLSGRRGLLVPLLKVWANRQVRTGLNRFRESLEAE